MSLSKADIAKLLAIPDKKPRAKTGAEFDTSVRDYQTWFKLANKILDSETKELATCDNPACHDPRHLAGKKAIMVAEINGKNCCRTCFFEGWLLVADPLPLG